MPPNDILFYIVFEGFHHISTILVFTFLIYVRIWSVNFDELQIVAEELVILKKSYVLKELLENFLFSLVVQLKAIFKIFKVFII